MASNLAWSSSGLIELSAVPRRGGRAWGSAGLWFALALSMPAFWLPGLTRRRLVVTTSGLVLLCLSHGVAAAEGLCHTIAPHSAVLTVAFLPLFLLGALTLASAPGRRMATRSAECLSQAAGRPRALFLVASCLGLVALGVHIEWHWQGDLRALAHFGTAFDRLTELEGVPLVEGTVTTGSSMLSWRSTRS